MKKTKKLNIGAAKGRNKPVLTSGNMRGLAAAKMLTEKLKVEYSRGHSYFIDSLPPVSVTVMAGPRGKKIVHSD